jgi:hypothetical protein
MAVVELLFGRKEATKIKKTGTPLDSVWELAFDATLSEQGEFQNRITSYPVESGSNISDHVIHEPEEVTLEGLVSKASLNYLGIAAPNISQGTVLAPERSSDPVFYAYLKLLEFAGFSYPVSLPDGQIIEAPKTLPLVDILTEFRFYTGMALQRLSVPRKAETGDALVFTVSFKKVRQVSVQEVTQNIASGDTAPAGAARADTQAPDKVEAGKQEPEKLQSVLFRGTHIGQ